MTTLAEALAGPAEGLAWACADERASGAEVLAIARPGLRLCGVAGEPALPRAALHAWVLAAGERLIRAYHGFGAIEAHEGQWLAQSLAWVPALAEPPGPDADEVARQVMRTLATVAIPARMRSGHAAEMGSVYAWAESALQWAGKRHLGDRRCAEEPPSLLARAIELHREVARHRGRDPEAAAAEERAAQVASLLACWREALAGSESDSQGMS